MTDKTGNSFISTLRMELPSANLGKVDHGEFVDSVDYPGDFDNDRQLEVTIWPPKPEILISLNYDR